MTPVEPDAFLEGVRADHALYRAPLPTFPPGMVGEDVPLYGAFLAHPPIGLVVAFFNVRVGPVSAAMRGEGGLELQLSSILHAPRVDMLVFDGRGWWVVEFHGQAGLPQLGRLSCYPELVAATYPQAPPLRSLMVAQRVNPFVLPCFTRRSIWVVTYASPTSVPHLVNDLGP